MKRNEKKQIADVVERDEKGKVGESDFAIVEIESSEGRRRLSSEESDRHITMIDIRRIFITEELYIYETRKRKEYNNDEENS